MKKTKIPQGDFIISTTEDDWEEKIDKLIKPLSDISGKETKNKDLFKSGTIIIKNIDK